MPSVLFCEFVCDGRLVVVAQSIINIRSDKDAQIDKNGCEILIRIQDDNSRLVPPNAFCS